MSSHPASGPYYLAEWYRSHLTSGELEDAAASLQSGVAAVCGTGEDVKLLMALAIPTDEVLFGLFAAPSAQAVREACRRAGLPAERLTDALGTRFADVETAVTALESHS